jgi:hypothetical protein
VPSRRSPVLERVIRPNGCEPLADVPHAPRSDSSCLGVSQSSLEGGSGPESLLATISQSAKPGPLLPDVWECVLREAEVPDWETIVAAIRHGVPLTLENRPYPAVRVPNHPMLYFDLPRVKQAVEKEVQHGRYVMLPPFTDPALLNVSAMGVAPRFKSFETRRAFERFIHQYRPFLKHAALDDTRGRPVSSGPGLAALGSGCSRGL